MLVLERLCSRFHRVAQQLRARPGQRATLHVEDERDVQDLLQALLHLEHDDIRPAEWMPSYAGGSARTDFILGLEHIVVSAKKTRDGFGAKEVEEQLAVDVQQYAQHSECRTLVCFVYDPDGRLANPRDIENALSGDRGALAVRVIIAPKGL